MKKILLSLLCTMLLLSSCKEQTSHQPSYLQEAEKRIYQLYQAEDYEKKEEYTVQFAKLLQEHPETMNYDFPLLTDSAYISILTSEDGKVRVYSWDDQLGGTMRWYCNVVQIKTKDSVKTTYYHPSPCPQEDEKVNFYEGYYKQMITVKGDKKDYYLLVYNVIGSTLPECRCQYIIAFALENDELVHQKKFFDILEGDFLDKICEYGFSDEEVKYKNKELYVPHSYDNTNDFEKYILYRFEGNLFRLIKD